jgi:hypothetical protein
MKFSLKHGMGLLAGLFLSAAALASEPVPIEDRDAFEKEYLACFMPKAKGNCFSSVFSGRFYRRLESENLLMDKLDSMFSERIKTVVRIYNVKQSIRYDLVESRSYLIQYSDKSLRGLVIDFIKQEDGWYVFGLVFDDSTDFVRKILDLSFFKRSGINVSLTLAGVYHG